MSHSQTQNCFNETQTQYGKCYDFNNKGRCTRVSCRYLHICIKCSGFHSVVVCITSRPPQPAKFVAGTRNGKFYNDQRCGFRSQGLRHGFRFPNRRQTASLDQLVQLGRTPVKVERLSEYLNLYPNRKDAHISLHGFLNCFRVNYDGPRVSSDCNNLISAREHASQLEETFSKK